MYNLRFERVSWRLDVQEHPAVVYAQNTEKLKSSFDDINLKLLIQSDSVHGLQPVSLVMLSSIHDRRYLLFANIIYQSLASVILTGKKRNALHNFIKISAYGRSKLES